MDTTGKMQLGFEPEQFDVRAHALNGYQVETCLIW